MELLFFCRMSETILPDEVKVFHDAWVNQTASNSELLVHFSEFLVAESLIVEDLLKFINTDERLLVFTPEVAFVNGGLSSLPYLLF